MRVLFDQATPVPIRPFLTGHTVSTAAHEGWDKLQNGDLLEAAEAAGFEVFLTTDKNIRYQQNLTGKKIAIVLIRRQQWPDLKPHVQLVVAAVNSATTGSYTEVEVPFK
jgi:hypothetical protein